MSSQTLTTYLNDHLAGSVVALELLEHLAALHRGSPKLRLDDPGNGELRVLEALETLGLGIQGKLALWRALSVAADGVPQLRTVDFARLERRALDQHGLVEAQRLEAARLALKL